MKVVRDTGVAMQLPPRKAHEPFPVYSRRVQRAAARVGRVYRMLYMRLRDLPGTRQQEPFEPFQRYLSAVRETAWQFEQAAGGRVRNRIELRVAFVYPAKQWGHAARLANALDAPSCAPRPP